jgi:hypothetical protein
MTREGKRSWSLVLRRRAPARDDALADKLERLIVTYRVVMIAPIWQFFPRHTQCRE